jgi:nucleotide-binding universal stress UspA family protein
MKHILAALDFPDVTVPVVEAAAEQARMSGAKLWILHVAAPEPDFVGYEAGPQHVRDARAAELREEHRALQAIKEELAAEGLNAEALLISGFTADTILAEAERLAADLIVIGSHGHSLLHDLLIGSVCVEVIRRSPLPVLAVPKRREA